MWCDMTWFNVMWLYKALFIVHLYLVDTLYKYIWWLSTSIYFKGLFHSNVWDTKYVYACTPGTGIKDTIPRHTNDTPWVWHGMAWHHINLQVKIEKPRQWKYFFFWMVPEFDERLLYHGFSGIKLCPTLGSKIV